jgi:N6-adenosine-specific RNA methylase IME4
VTWEGLSPPYATIVADPPWPFSWKAGAGGRRRRATALPYSVLTVDAIKALPVSELAAEAAHLYLWVTRDLFREGHGVAVARAWGFEPVGEFIWRKPNFSTGAFPRPGHEPLLVCRRGALPFTGGRDVHSVQDWRQHYECNSGKQHSRKPIAALDLVEAASPAPRVELFARAPRLGWDSWGLGYEGSHDPLRLLLGRARRRFPAGAHPPVAPPTDRRRRRLGGRRGAVLGSVEGSRPAAGSGGDGMTHEEFVRFGAITSWAFHAIDGECSAQEAAEAIEGLARCIRGGIGDGPSVGPKERPGDARHVPGHGPTAQGGRT